MKPYIYGLILAIAISAGLFVWSELSRRDSYIAPEYNSDLSTETSTNDPSKIFRARGESDD
jgi:hypothetical protein